MASAAGAAADSERSPLLGNKLNPRAASFNFTPKDRLQPQPQPTASTWTGARSNQHDAIPTTSSYAAVAATRTAAESDEVQNIIHQHPTLTPTTLNGSHSHSSSLSHPSLIPPPFSHPRSRSRSRSSSCSSASSTTSSSCCSLPPYSQFTHSHLAQFLLSTLLCLLLLAALIYWKHQLGWPEFLLGASAWLAGQGCKETVFEVFGPRMLELPAPARGGEEEASPSPSRKRRSASWAGRGLGVPTVLHALLQEFLRLGAITCMVALLPSDSPSPSPSPSTSGIPPPTRGGGHPRAPLPPLDVLFFSALWMAMGWAMVEIVWGNRDFWRRMKLYDEVLGGGGGGGGGLALGEEEEEDLGFHSSEEEGSDEYDHDQDDSEFLSSSSFNRVLEGRATTRAELAREQQVEQEMEARGRQSERDEIEAQLGVPLYEIPVAVVFVWRLDSILLSLLLTLLLSLPFRTTSPSLIPFPLWPTFILTASLHAFLSLLWCLRIKYVGIPSISYATLVVLVFFMFAVLAAWGALE